MFAKVLKTSAVLLAAAHLASAQTFSECNPYEGDKCPDNPAFGGTFEIDFTKGESEYFDVAAGTTLEYDDTNGAVFTISKETDAPTISSNKYIFFGSVEVVMQASPGQGVVTSIVLESDDLDEIDWEWLGGDTKQVQTNYFGKGNTSSYDRGGFSAVSSPQTTFRTYKIDWSPEAIVWSIDGVDVRTLKYADADGAGEFFPQTPMQLKLGTWDAGASTSPTGTVQWAGGYTPFGSGSGAPYKAYYKSVKIVDRSNGVSGATAYAYGDSSGSYESIIVKTDGSSSSSSSSSSKGSSTATAKSSASSEAASSSSATATAVTTGTATKTGATTTKTGTSTAAANGTVAATTSAVSVSGAVATGANIVGLAAALFAAFTLL